VKKTGLLVAVGLTSLAFLSTSWAADKHMGAKYEMKLVSLNNSGVTAEVELLRIGDKLHVELEAEGLEPGKPHPQHIHGFVGTDKNSTCPGVEADSNGDGIISVQEGAPSYGPVVLALVPFNLVSDEGELKYEAMFTLAEGDLQPLDRFSVVLHGMTIGSDYVASTPVACGEIALDAD